MAAVSQRASGIPQPVSKTRGPSRLASMQSQFQQREAADRQKKLAELAPVRATPSETARPAAAPGRTQTELGHRGAAPPAVDKARQASSVNRGKVNGSVGSSVGPVSAGARGAPSSSGSGGKVRAMFQTRRAGTAAQTSPVGWDRSYPLDPIKKTAPAPSRAAAQPPPPAASKPAAAPPARSRRPEAVEPRRPAPPRAAAAPPRSAPAPTRPTRTPAKENQPPSAAGPRPPPADPNLAQCPICSRAFAKDRLDKHQAICEKSTKKKRKVFDPVKMRVQGTESESYLRKIKSKKPEKVAPPKKDWRKQHEEFIRNIRAAKKAQAHLAAGGKLEDLPPPPPMDTSDYVTCPHCGRRFSEAAADRHVPKCATIASNKPAAGRAQKSAARAPPARLRR
ncbi:actin cytoskeleton-regulatory complex protein pan-1-like isoform X2 [Pollicipes pollicipes]|uniref:actin cytoskeleton-regulatory complex protein pan-1-like isoform X2 n=1 Tax=Pollicipes pollicipes TaxID=41117 RepID=UPI0018851113|nr:actin cytoskeleton-regulatory complex protein pan-1-like isoform X2 [Pollicipes pollicipes]